MTDKPSESGNDPVSPTSSDSGQTSDLFAAYASPAAICILDSEQRYVWVNHEFSAINGISASGHLGKTIREVLGDFAGYIEPYFHGVLSSRQPTLNAEVSALHPLTKTHVHWRIHLFPIANKIESIGRVGIVVIEATKEKKLERAVQDLDGKLRKEMKRVQSLADINALLTSNWDKALVFPQVSALIRRVLRQEMASLVLYDGENNKLVRCALDFPLSKGLIAQSPVSAEDSPAQRALVEGTPAILARNDLQSLDSLMARGLVSEGLQALCCVPMMRPKGPFGVLILGSTREQAFHQDDLGWLTQVANQLALAMENHLAASEIKLLRQRLGEERQYLEGEIEYEGDFTEIVGSSPALKQVLQQVTTVATSGATVLILGETGTGKELIARAIHRLGRRKEQPFIKVNCAAIPTGLLESELFGHEKGAFTGAITQKIGRIQLANRGTLFLDEVGEISPELQPKLLRVLQDQEFERLGSNQTIKVDVRIVAATNRNLAERVAQAQFRSDLYCR